MNETSAIAVATERTPALVGHSGGRTLEPLSDDLLQGCAAIAAFLGVSRRRAFYLLENKLIPSGKEGAAWISSKAALRQHYAVLIGTPKTSAA